MSFSNGDGGTLALPSPTHAHHMDVTSAVRTLRRSMSRSPSTKFLSRSNSQASDGSPQYPEPRQSPSCRRFGLTPARRLPAPPHVVHSAPPVSSQNQLQSSFTPLRPSGRLSLRSAKSAKSATPSRPMSRLRASPRSPVRRPLNSTHSDSINASPSSAFASVIPVNGQENTSPGQRSSPLCRSLEKPSRHSLHLDVSGSSQEAFMKALEESKSPVASTTGALKRSDAAMNLDQPNQGSPVAKRRSLHGFAAPITTPVEEMNIFGAKPAGQQSFEIHEDLNPEYELSAATDNQPFEFAASPTTSSGVNSRSSSLRKTTLQQRYGEKTSWGRRSGERQLAQLVSEGTASPARSRPRLSNDHFLPPQVPRDSPFSPRLPMGNASAQPVETAKSQNPHPLSKALSNSSSGNSLEEKSQAPLYAPARAAFEVPPKPRGNIFSKSLPLNATRPTARSTHDYDKAGISTPAGSDQIWQGAFNTTGLVSKFNRNIEEEARNKIVAPDTPCKKHANPFNTFPPPFSSALKKRSNNNQSNRNSFSGTPSTPFTPGMSADQDLFDKPSKGLSIFQRGSALRKSRRGSLLGFDDEERKLFDENHGDAMVTNDGDIPPTPTKNTLTPSASNLSQQSLGSSLDSPSANRTAPISNTIAAPPQPPFSTGRTSFSRESTSKSPTGDPEPFGTTMGEVPAGVKTTGPTANGSNKPPFPILPLSTSFGRSRASSEFRAPSPLFLVATAQDAQQDMIAKHSSANTESPLDGRRTPQTPQEGYLPWDASRLSISFNAEGLRESGTAPPVTPTGGRDMRSSTAMFVTPANVRTVNVDIDASLTSRFEKVEWAGKGEFSSVFRVETSNHVQSAVDFLAGTPQHRAPASPSKISVFAVKKSKLPFTGHKDREAKLMEVKVLQALTHAEHVVHYVDSWEHNYHLYIQTEFCEEGSLQTFLSQVGRGGRLDDFRIFKMLQDLLLGLKEIHDAGFMHLDIKPANVLVTFEGVLKIGDFGLAKPNSPEKVDVEGDREYMAPEMLNGVVDASADIFSLGLIILEAAANVCLPDNGPTWIALRSGDLSEVPSLTWTPSSEIQRDASGFPQEPGFSDDLATVPSHSGGDLFGFCKKRDMQQPPDFMVNPAHSSSLDSIVRWMTMQKPEDRPIADQILELDGLLWIADHRKAPATVYEGNWGPADPAPVSILVDSDSEMMDV